MTTKMCSRCKEEKPTTAFTKHVVFNKNKTYTGLQTYCIPCRAAYSENYNKMKKLRKQKREQMLALTEGEE